MLVLGRGKAEKRDYEKQRAVEEQLVYPDFNPDAATHITLGSLTNNVVDFKKISGYWMVADGGAFLFPGDDTDKAAEGEGIDSTEGGEHPEGEDTGPEEIVNTDETPAETVDDEGAAEDGGEDVDEEPEKELKYFLADETQVVDGILSMLKEMERGIRVSHDPSKHTSDFYVGGVLGVEVKVEDSDGNLMAHFYVGNAADMLSTSNYMRFNDEDDVYQVRQAWRNLVGKPFQTWRDKTMFDFGPGMIDRIQFSGTDVGDLVFVKDSEGGWSNEDIDWPFDGPKIDTAINRMSTLKATDFPRYPATPEETGLGDTDKRIILEGGGERFELLIGEVGEAEKLYSTTGHDDSTFMISQADVDIIFLDREALEVPEPPEPAEDEASE